jgi:hypothetical protein
MEKTFDVKLFFILLFLGWWGIDKLVKKNWKLCLIKFATTFIIIGVIWNIYDIVMCCLKRYEVNPFE